LVAADDSQAPGGRGRRGVQPARPTTTPAKPKPARLDLVDSVQIAAQFGDKPGRKTAAAREAGTGEEEHEGLFARTGEAASRPTLLAPASGPATRAAVTTRQGLVAQKRELMTQKEKDALHLLQQIKLAQRVAEYYSQAEQAATQQATARLQRLLITVNFRSPAAADREASAEIRAKDAAKRTDPASKE